MRKLAYGLVLALGFAPAAAAAAPVADPPFALARFGITRQRLTVRGSNLVAATFEVRAEEGANLRDLRARIEYKDFRGEVLGRAGPVRIGNLRPGEKRQTVLEGTHIPVFNGYLVKITGALDGTKGEWTFFGASGNHAPFYLPGKPVPRTCTLVCMASELEQKQRSPGASLYVRVRNMGDKRAAGATCTVQLLNKKGKPFGKPAKAKLSGAKGGRPGVVDGGEERLFIMRFRRFPKFESYSVSLDWESPPTEDLLAGGEFTGGPEVELGHFSFTKPGGDRIEIAGRARNGLDRPVENIRVKLHLLRKVKAGKKYQLKRVRTLSHLVPGRLEPGRTAPFRIAAEKVGSFDDFEYEVGYDEPGERKEARAAAAVGQAAVKVTKAARKAKGAVEINGVIENVGSGGIKNVKVLFSFKRRTDGGGEKVVGKHEYVMERSLRPGEMEDFRFTTKPFPRFDEYFYEVSYKPAGNR